MYKYKTVTSKTAAAVGPWRETRRQSARDAIVDAAWAAAHADGLASLSIRDLAKRAGITTPTVYAYFESKHAIYDAMFRKAAAEFADRMTQPHEVDNPRDLLVASAHRFVEFCTSDSARYQLLFQRVIPGFEPSSDSFAPAVAALEGSRTRLAANGITEARHLDLWTALTTGLVDQQISNDLGGSRWSSLIEEAVDMYLAHCAPPARQRRPQRPKSNERKWP
jgi:AcrR family transcriptional regulator